MTLNALIKRLPKTCLRINIMKLDGYGWTHLWTSVNLKLSIAKVRLLGHMSEWLDW